MVNSKEASIIFFMPNILVVRSGSPSNNGYAELQKIRRFIDGFPIL